MKMKRSLNTFLFISFIFTLLVAGNSCTQDKYSHYSPSFEKRRYSKGFYTRTVTAKNQSTRIKERTAPLNSFWKPEASLNIPFNPMEAIAGPDRVVNRIDLSHFDSFASSSKSNNPVVCDVILYRDGREREVRIEDVSTNEVRYRPCREPNGPLTVEGTGNILRIDYADGSRRYFERRDDFERPGQQQQVTVNQNINAAQREGQRTSHSQIIALLLILLLGSLAAHRFYLGYYGIAILQLITLGACGIWYLIDLIRIITGDLKPRNSDDYAEKL
jgi:hypothetical protein